MRYTTIIDLTEWPTLYKSPSIRLVYMHLCYVAGYHDYDRDLTGISLRRIAHDCGLTLSATRVAISRLQAYQLLERVGPLWRVKKYVMEAPISKREKSVKALKAKEVKMQEEQQRQARHTAMAKEERERESLRLKGKTSYMVWYETQLEQAEAGNPDAIRNVQTGKSTYEAHKKQIQSEAI